jgi:hypothetical protein
MPKGNPGQPRKKQTPGKPRPNRQKPHQRKTIKLSDRLVPIAENSLNGTTSSIELGLSIIEYLAKQASIGDEQAIEFLARFGVEAKIEECSPIVVYKPDGEVAAWIV